MSAAALLLVLLSFKEGALKADRLVEFSWRTFANPSANATAVLEDVVVEPQVNLPPPR